MCVRGAQQMDPDNQHMLLAVLGVMITADCV